MWWKWMENGLVDRLLNNNKGDEEEEVNLVNLTYGLAREYIFNVQLMTDWLVGAIKVGTSAR